MIMELMEQIVDEVSYAGLVRKQSDIGRLFPTFKDRVRAVGNHGGVRLVDMKPLVWSFKVTSGTKPGVRYDVHFKFKDIKPIIRQSVEDMKNWKQDRSGVDMRKLAIDVMFDANLQVFCSCPADLYYGGHYIRTHIGAKYTRPENRPPNKRNPKQYGAYCKHVALVMEVLPMYSGTIASWLRRFYSRDIERVENVVKRNLPKEDKPTESVFAVGASPVVAIIEGGLYYA